MKFKSTLSTLLKMFKANVVIALIFCSNFAYSQFNGTQVSVYANGFTFGPYTMSNTVTTSIDLSLGYEWLILSINPVSSQIKLAVTAGSDLGADFDVVFEDGDFASINTIAVNSAATSDGIAITASKANAYTVNVKKNEFVPQNMDRAIVWDFTASAKTLPVGLESFEVAKQHNSTILNWKTASEQNNKGFDIYRSGDDKQFVKVGELEGKGIAANYTFTDRSPLNGSNYYKLIQIDNDGKATELGVKNIAFSLAQQGLIAFPNPVINKVTVSFEPGSFNTSELIGLNGNVLKQVQLKLTDTQSFFDMSAFPKGIYAVRLTGNGKVTYQKVVKQ